uniref:Secreted protein n=1 Tax=Steinernema glaseri TaxID=37863 RepID=A0A1I7ZCU8_9BILA
MKVLLALSLALLLISASAFRIDEAFPFRRIRTRQVSPFGAHPSFPACFSLYRTCNDPCYEELGSFFLPSRCCCPPPCPYRDDC